MPNPETPSRFASSPTRVAELIAEYQRQQETWRNKTAELVRLRDQVLSVGEKDATTILTAAREVVQNALVEARRDLLALLAQVDAIREVNPVPRDAERSLTDRATVEGDAAATLKPDGGELESRSRIVVACRDLCQVAIETQAALSALQRDAVAFQTSVQLPRTELPGAGPATTEPHWRVKPVESAVALQAPPAVERPVAPDRPLRFSPEFETAFKLTAEAPGAGLAATQPDRQVTPSVTFLEPSERPGGRAIAGLAVVAVAGAVLAFVGLGLYRQPATTPIRNASTAPTPPSLAITPPKPKPVQASEAPSAATAARPAQSALVVEAKRQAWIQATIDGRVQPGRILRTAETQRLTGTHEVSLRVGDGGAVVVSATGLKPAPLGRDGEVVTRRFTADGSTWLAERHGSPSNAPVIETPGTEPGGDPKKPSGTTPPAPAPAQNAAAGAAAVSETIRVLTDTAQRWMLAYYRRDMTAMRAFATPEFNISDDRTAGERPPAGLSQIRLVLEQVTCQVVGTSVVLTGRMTEQASTGDDRTPYMSWISQTWIKADEEWRLVDARVVANSRLQKK